MSPKLAEAIEAHLKWVHLNDEAEKAKEESNMLFADLSHDDRALFWTEYVTEMHLR